jgi:hypothetical protein
MLSEEDKKLQNHWAWLLGVIILCIPSVLWWAYVLQTIWAWYIPLAPLSTKTAVGIGILIGYLRAKPSSTENPSPTMLVILLHMTMVPALMLFWAWIVLKLVF